MDYEVWWEKCHIFSRTEFVVGQVKMLKWEHKMSSIRWKLVLVNSQCDTLSGGQKLVKRFGNTLCRLSFGGHPVTPKTTNLAEKVLNIHTRHRREYMYSCSCSCLPMISRPRNDRNFRYQNSRSFCNLFCDTCWCFVDFTVWIKILFYFLTCHLLTENVIISKQREQFIIFAVVYGL